MREELEGLRGLVETLKGLKHTYAEEAVVTIDNFRRGLVRGKASAYGMTSEWVEQEIRRLEVKLK